MMPDRLGKYELRGVLGRGAMGTVYDGWDPAIGRRVAIKTIGLADAREDTETAEALERFRREAQAAGRLSHANVVGVYDMGETDEIAYIVMEFIDGRSLKSVLDAEGALPPARAASILAQVLAGLEYSHRHGVIHRDIKPANVMLTAEGVVKLADFGIARIASSTATAVGTVLGTPAYMPPEQFLGEPADERSDIYAAGAMLFHMLTGTRPYEGSPTSIMTRVLHAPAPPSPTERAAALDPRWDAVTARAMARAPADRFASAADFAAAIHAAASSPADADATIVAAAAPRQPTAPIATSAPQSAGKGAGRLIALGALALALAGGGGAAWWFTSRPRPIATAPIAPPAPHPVAAPEPPAPSLETRLAAIATELQAARCTTASAARSGATILVSGVAGRTAEETLRSAAEAHDSGLIWRVAPVTDADCPLLDLLHTLPGTLPLAIPDQGPGPIPSHQLWHFSVGPPPFSGAWLRADYITGTEKNPDALYAYHITPSVFRPQTVTLPNGQRAPWVGEAPRRLAAGEVARFGDYPGQTPLAPAPPYGTDLLLAIVSDDPALAEKQRSIAGPLDAYVAWLSDRIAAAQRSGKQVAYGLVAVTTAER